MADNKFGLSLFFFVSIVQFILSIFQFFSSQFFNLLLQKKKNRKTIVDTI